MSKSIKLSKIYNHPIHKVWSAITNAEALSEWLMPCDFRPELNAEFTFRTKSYPGFDGITYCKVVRLDEPHHLAYIWSGGALKDTLVTFKLSKIDEKNTKLDFEHSGFKGFVNSVIVRRILANGWKRKILSIQLPNYLKS